MCWRAPSPTSAPAAAWPGCARRSACRSCRRRSTGRPPSCRGTTRRFRDAAAPAASGAALPDWWPGSSDPLVYVTFGSVAASFGLFPVLYQGVVAAVADLPVRVLLTLGEAGDPEALGPLPANVHVERWWPQADVMPHASALVGHGGTGTTLAGLAAGIPQVVVPLFADQPYNAERVEAVNAGVALQGGPAAIGGLLRSPAAGPRRGLVPGRRPADGRADRPPPARVRGGADAGGDRRPRPPLRPRLEPPFEPRFPAIRRVYRAFHHPPRSFCFANERGSTLRAIFPPSGQQQRSWPRGEEPARGFRHLNQAVDIGGASARPKDQHPGLGEGVPGQVDAGVGGPALRCDPGRGGLPHGHHQLPGQRQRQPGDGLPGGRLVRRQHGEPAQPRRHHQQLAGQDRHRPQAHPGPGRHHRGRPFVDQRQAHGDRRLPGRGGQPPSRPFSARWVASTTS